MKKVLIVCAHRAGRSPSQRYRFEQYLLKLEQHGYRFTYSYLLDQKTDPLFYSPGNIFSKAIILFHAYLQRKRDIRHLDEFDIVFEQRESHFLGTTFFEKAVRKAGKPLIFDFDDSIWLADTSPGNKKWEWLKKPEKIFTAFRLATHIIAGNQYLANKALPYNSHVSIIPTTVDTDVHYPRPELRGRTQVVIGWSGSISTLKHFNLVLPVLKKIKAKYGDQVIIRIMADKSYRHPELELESLIWSADKEVEYLNTFDIGIMPLPDDEWSRGKCGLKGLTYMACGVPVVMSAVGVNTEIVQHYENGLLASDEEQWQQCLASLIEDTSLRQKIGEAGRQAVEKKYSVNVNLQKYLAVFSAC